ncbi:MAG: hypothetical protein QJR03_05460 [Sphaerobacter sp.]|nr:hypothetical protein [Sphaerobacter sp.]
MARGRVILAVVLTSLVLLAGCGPEASRTRGGGPGADIGNRSGTVQLHGDSQGERSIYVNTPRKLPGSIAAGE